MNKTLLTLLLLAVLSFVGYKYYYKSECSTCQSHSISQEVNSSTQEYNSSSTTLNEVSDLDTLIANTKPSIVKIYLDGCPPCEEAALVYPEVIAQFPQLDFYNLNVANVDVMNALVEKNIIEAPVTAAPTFLYVKNGRAIEALQGFNGKESLIENINRLLN